MTSFLERFFRKTIPSDITYEDFLNFRKQNIEEHQYLDYKSGEILVGHEGHCIGRDGKVLPLDMVDNSTSPCERISGWFSPHSIIQVR